MELHSITVSVYKELSMADSFIYGLLFWGFVKIIVYAEEIRNPPHHLRGKITAAIVIETPCIIEHIWVEIDLSKH